MTKKLVNEILYFIVGEVPTNKEFEKAEPFMNKGPFLEFVSLVTLDLNAPLRDNVGVAGAVPDAYKQFKVLDATPVKVSEEKAKK